MSSQMTAFWRDERGATSIEYVLIAGFLSILIVVGVRQIGVNISRLFYTPMSQALS